MREAWISILANLVALVAIYSAFSVGIAVAQALGPATPIGQALALAGAVVLGLLGISGALFQLSDRFTRHVEADEEGPSSQDAARPAHGETPSIPSTLRWTQARCMLGLLACSGASRPSR